jgi:hypothetical protein
MNMPLEPSWSEIALTMLAGAVIGFDRGAQGQAAGFRTAILVGWRRQPPRARPTFCCRWAARHLGRHASEEKAYPRSTVRAVSRPLASAASTVPMSRPR